MANHVRVLLQDDVENLGTGGEIVKVRAGFARNYLLPRGIALPATEANLARVEDLKKLAAQRAKEELERAQEASTKIEAVTVRIERSAAMGEASKMYGSVTAKDLQEAFEAKGVTLDRKKIQLAEPLRQFGPFEVPLRLHPSITTTLKGEIVKKGS